MFTGASGSVNRINKVVVAPRDLVDETRSHNNFAPGQLTSLKSTFCFHAHLRLPMRLRRRPSAVQSSPVQCQMRQAVELHRTQPEPPSPPLLTTTNQRILFSQLSTLKTQRSSEFTTTTTTTELQPTDSPVVGDGIPSLCAG